jgi:hypothetical protein
VSYRDESRLALLNGVAVGCPFPESADDRPRIHKSLLSQLERRTGAGFFGRSTAVRDDRLSQAAQVLDV